MRMVVQPQRVFSCCLVVAVFLGILSGCTPAPVHNTVTAISLDNASVTLSATDVFYTFEGAPNHANNGISRMQTDGTLPSRISPAKDIGRVLYVSGDYVYFLGVDSLYRVKKTRHRPSSAKIGASRTS